MLAIRQREQRFPGRLAPLASSKVLILAPTAQWAKLVAERIIQMLAVVLDSFHLLVRHIVLTSHSAHKSTPAVLVLQRRAKVLIISTVPLAPVNPAHREKYVTPKLALSLPVRRLSTSRLRAVAILRQEFAQTVHRVSTARMDLTELSRQPAISHTLARPIRSPVLPATNAPKLHQLLAQLVRLVAGKKIHASQKRTGSYRPT